MTSFAALGASSLLVITGLTLASSATASASTTLPCNEAVANAPGALVTTPSGVLIVGVGAGTTQITISCNTSSGAAYALEASLLGGIGTTAVVASNKADLATLATFAPDATSVACPAGVAGQCTTTVFSVPATFSATDNKAACPSTSSQVDNGLFACAVAVVNSSIAPIPGGEFLVTYANQPSPSVSASAPVFSVHSLVGHVVEGRTVTVTILGTGFYGQPSVVSDLGTIARVSHDTGQKLSVVVSAAKGSRNGWFTFTVTLKNGTSARVRYLQVA